MSTSRFTSQPTSRSVPRLVGRPRAAHVGAAGAALALVTLIVPLTGVPAQAAAPPACTASMTKVSFGNTDGAAGSIYGTMRVTNVSTRTCTIHGYGGISYVGHGNGTQIGAAADRTAARVGTVTLRPRQSATAQVRMVEAGDYGRRHCRPTAVDGFRVYLPGETHSKYVAYPTTGCANPNVHLLSSKPYRAA
ncbi:DUF4232 domain-containing protein [Nocardioides sp.]|uniref:DUF4232 domain-containing protein n=1 Tax=Nocardioides sp. TaxID=35761 RepID=UPI002601EC41|nr:DUF4232 domain-containing protein [Nocardioides sp.]